MQGLCNFMGDGTTPIFPRLTPSTAKHPQIPHPQPHDLHHIHHLHSQPHDLHRLCHPQSHPQYPHFDTLSNAPLPTPYPALPWTGMTTAQES